MKLSRRTLSAQRRCCARRARRSIALAVAAGARARRRQEWRHGLSLFGDLKYPAGFKHFDYVNPNAPKGGAVRLGAFGTFDNFNLVVAGVKGTLAAGIDLIYDTLMVAGARRGLDRIRAARRGGQLSGRFLLGHLSAARRSEVARRQAGDAGGRDLLVRGLQEASIRSSPPITATSPRRRRPASARSPSPSTAGNRELPQIVGQLNVLPKHWWEGTDAYGKKRDITRDHARAAARQRRLPDQGVRRPAAPSSTSASRTTGARISTSTSAATISTRCATSISATRPSRSRPSRATSRLAHREQRQELGDRLRFPGGARTSASCWRNSRSAASA